MYSEFLAHTFCICLFILQCVIHASAKKEATFEFDVKPGGDTHTFTEKLDAFSCSFTYSSQGGTNENWLMVIKKGKNYSCDITRPDKDSYLMFEKFELKFDGAKLADAIVYSNKDLKDVGDEEFVKDYSTHSVRNTDRFKNKLHRVIAVSHEHKEEL